MPSTARYLLLTYLLTLMGPAAIMLDFLVEQDRIAKELCVQKAVPEMERTCHGQCHLAKQLKATEQAEGTKEPRIPPFRYEIQFFDTEGFIPFRSSTEAHRCFGEFLQAELSDGYPRSMDGVPWC